MTKIEEILKILDWIPKARDILKPFEPEIRTMRVNYCQMDAEIRFALNIPDNFEL